MNECRLYVGLHYVMLVLSKKRKKKLYNLLAGDLSIISSYDSSLNYEIFKMCLHLIHIYLRIDFVIGIFDRVDFVVENVFTRMFEIKLIRLEGDL